MLRCYIAFAVAGLAIGWLMGLSISPITSVVLTSVMGSLSALLAGFQSMDKIFGSTTSKEDGTKGTTYLATVISFSVLAASIAIGAPIGIQARTGNWFGPSPKTLIENWARLGVDRSEVRKRVFNSHFPTDGKNSLKNPGVLFSNAVNECQELQALPPHKLKKGALGATNNYFSVMAEYIEQEENLKEAINRICNQK